MTLEPMVNQLQVIHGPEFEEHALQPMHLYCSESASFDANQPHAWA